MKVANHKSVCVICLCLHLFIIFLEDRMRLGKVNANKQKFLCLACVLTFHYLCK